MKLFSLLKYNKKSTQNLKALKKTKLVLGRIFHCHVNKTVCSIQHSIPQIRTVSERHMNDTAVNWCILVV